MGHRYSASTNAFFHVGVHAADQIPADAVPITEKRHQELLAGQAEGRRIHADKHGKPQVSPKVKPTAAQLRRLANGDIRREARRRILAIAGLERQANDNAAIAMLALSLATGTDLGDELAAHQATTRRQAIDAIRAASNRVEATIATWSAGALEQFNAADTAYWPKEPPR